MSTTLRVLTGVLCVVIAFGAFLMGKNIPFSQQWPIFEGLRTTASIVFAVVGAWMAIAYPERLKLTLRGDAKALAPMPRMAALLTPITHSTIILALVLLVSIGAPIAKSLPFLTSNLAVCRGISFAMAVVLTLWQACIVLLTLRPADAIKSADDVAHATQSRLSSVFGNTQTENESSPEQS